METVVFVSVSVSVCVCFRSLPDSQPLADSALCFHGDKGFDRAATQTKGSHVSRMTSSHISQQ